MSRGQYAIVGIGEVPTGRFPDRPALESALVCCRDAIRDAGLAPGDIDAIIPTGAIYSRHYNTDLIFSRLVEELGLNGKAHMNMQVFAGGASSASMLKTAGGLVVSGAANHVLCVHSDKLGTGVTGQESIDLFSSLGMHDEWETPFGLHYSALAGLITQRYMYETGTTVEQLAAVNVSNRKWAQLNPNAWFRKDLTVEDVLASKMLSEPIRTFDSNVFCDGGSAFIVTTADRARELTDRPVYLLGHGSRVTHFSLTQTSDITRFGFAEASRDAYEQAGLQPGDMDIAEIYDGYAAFSLITLEECGLVGRGKGGAFVESGETSPGGTLPMTTNGGMLSQGHSGAGGGVAVLVEAARQLMGKAGERQVPDVRFALETASGGAYMDSQVAVLGNEIP